MSTRENILAAVLKNQPALTLLPDVSDFGNEQEGKLEKYQAVFAGIGGAVYLVENMVAAKTIINEKFDIKKRIVTTLRELGDTLEYYSADADPHSFADVEAAVIGAQFGVAENGAVWLTEQHMGQRILPFICQHLVVLITAESIVSTMHEAYAKIGEDEYGFGAFIGGPSKTADIEQALVLGAHGPVAMTVLILKQ